MDFPERERRTASRSPARRRVWVSDVRGRLQEACTEDVSATGMRLRVPGAVSMGEQMDVELFPADGAQTPLAPVRAHVRWARPVPGGSWRAGIQFETGPCRTEPVSLPLPVRAVPRGPRALPPGPGRPRRKRVAAASLLLLALLFLLLAQDAVTKRPQHGGAAVASVEVVPAARPAVTMIGADAAGTPGDGGVSASAPGDEAGTPWEEVPPAASPAPGEWPGIRSMAAYDARDLPTVGDAPDGMVEALGLEPVTEPSETDGLRIVIETGAYRLSVFRGGQLVCAMPVGLGRDGATPPGDYYIANKITQPTWYNRGNPVAPGDPANPLGARWMGLGQEGQATPLGMHPTAEDDSIGQPMSRGCVRLRPADAETLFRLCPLLTPVQVVP